MPRRFTGIRLLLVFVAINTVMMLMLVTSMAGTQHWLTRVLPGDWSEGHSSGLWLFFSLVLLVNAVVVLLAGVITLLPSMGERDGYLLMVGRAITLVGALFCVVAFGSVTASFTRALPASDMFVFHCELRLVICETPQAPRPIPNSQVDVQEIEMFTLDQLAGAILLSAPEIYDFRVSPLTNNAANPLFTNFTFAFRVMMVLSALLLLASFARRAPRKSNDDDSSAEPPAQEHAA
ncbi:MAG: hypothetical protein HY243_03100 [Proteobacteria bacterium]|nr:hypothetical protein [Pseudomonadota bacterium]